MGRPWLSKPTSCGSDVFACSTGGCWLTLGADRAIMPSDGYTRPNAHQRWGCCRVYGDGAIEPVFLKPPRLPSLPRLSHVAWRLFWMGMLAVHAGAIRSVVLELASLTTTEWRLAVAVRLFVLAVSALFFCLKLIDIRWLRLRPGWCSKIYSLVVIGIIHLGVVERVTHSEFVYSPGHLGVVLFAGGALGVRPLSGLLPRLLRMRSAPPRVSPLFSLRFLHRLAHGLCAHPCRVTLRACVAPRAPPILS